MSDSQELDELLRRSMAPQSPPTLSLEFEQRLASRLRPPRLSSKSRYGLLGFGLLGVTASLAAMFAAGTPWWVGGPCVVVPLMVVAGLCRPHFR